MDGFESGQMLPWEAAFSTSVAQARAAVQMSREELARRMREYGLLFHAHDVEKIESGAQPIRLNEALVISKVLQVGFPEVTTTVRVELITRAYSQNLAKVVRDWDKVVDKLRTARADVIQVVENSAELHSSYTEEIGLAGGKEDPELDASMKAVEYQIRKVRDSLDDIDQHLNGALSRPSIPASLPGSQM